MGRKLKQGKKKMSHELFCFWFFKMNLVPMKLEKNRKKVQILGTSYIPKNLKFFETMFYSP